MTKQRIKLGPITLIIIILILVFILLFHSHKEESQQLIDQKFEERCGSGNEPSIISKINPIIGDRGFLNITEEAMRCKEHYDYDAIEFRIEPGEIMGLYDLIQDHPDNYLINHKYFQINNEEIYEIENIFDFNFLGDDNCWNQEERMYPVYNGTELSYYEKKVIETDNCETHYINVTFYCED